MSIKPCGCYADDAERCRHAKYRVIDGYGGVRLHPCQCVCHVNDIDERVLHAHAWPHFDMFIPTPVPEPCKGCDSQIRIETYAGETLISVTKRCNLRAGHAEEWHQSDEAHWLTNTCTTESKVATAPKKDAVLLVMNDPPLIDHKRIADLEAQLLSCRLRERVIKAMLLRVGGSVTFTDAELRIAGEFDIDVVDDGHLMKMSSRRR